MFFVSFLCRRLDIIMTLILHRNLVINGNFYLSLGVLFPYILIW